MVFVISVCIPTYILGPLNSENKKYFTDEKGCDLCINLTYLGLNTTNIIC